MNRNQKKLIELEEIIKEKAEHSEGTKYENLQNYIGTQLNVAGLRSAEIKECYKLFSKSLEGQTADHFDFWNYKWNNSQWFEVLSMPLLFVRSHSKKIERNKLFSTIKQWQNRIDNWAHSDELAHAFANQLIASPKETLELLKSFNKSANFWDRRQSLVVLIRINRPLEFQLSWDQIMEFVFPLINDDAYYVQKGVGWVLRDAGRSNSRQLKNFLREYATELSSPAFATATEKVEIEFKEELKQLRKNGRKFK